MRPHHSRIHENGYLVILYDSYKQAITPVDQIYWQLCREFGKREVDEWDDETYFQAWAALCVIGEQTDQAAQGETGGK